MRPGRGLLLLLDFDGTLSALAPAPAAARMAAPVRRLLGRLGRRRGLRLAVISGRTLADVAGRVGVPDIYYGGNHGLEMKGPGFAFRHPEGFALAPAMEKVEALCRETLKRFPGVVLEAKGAGLAVHDRLVARRDLRAYRRALGGVMSATENLPVAWMRGRRVWEALPRVDWNKGRAAELLGRHLGGPVPFAVGDDVTDEALFRSANRTGLSVRVAPRGPTAARYALPDQAEVPLLLRRLEEFMGPDGPGEEP